MNNFFEKLRGKIYKKRTTIIVWVFAAILFFVFFGANFNTILSLVQQKKALSQEIEYETERAATLDAQLESVGTKAYIEQIAREKYNLYYPDELIVTTEYETENNE